MLLPIGIMRILITGICGFAGSVIARGLLEHLVDVRITGLDSLIRKGSETNLEPLRSLGIDVRVGDIRNEDDLGDLPPADWVIDCAANPSVLAGVDGKTSAKELLDHNLIGTINLLEYCRNHRAGFLLLSTSRVYSIAPLAGLPVEVIDNAYRPALVNDAPDRSPSLSSCGLTEQFPTEPPVSLYGSSKKCSELLALEYGMTFDFPVRINRCGVLAGAGQFGKADQGIFSYWIHSWASRRPLKYIGFGGSGHQVRDCLHPRDLVPLLLSQMRDPERNVPPVLNVSGGAGSAMSLAQLSAWCLRRFGDHQVAADSDPRPFDIPWMVLNSTAAQEAWNWRPSIPNDVILEEIARHALDNPNWLKKVS
jgi:CDP-paratose 2-epimerase